jgi:peptidoglycan hydrolase-like protein with peptidoglycan-binding domain
MEFDSLEPSVTSVVELAGDERRRDGRMVLRNGDKGEAVRTLQRGLNRLGSMVLVDETFGVGTRDAVVRAREQLGRPGPAEADEALQQLVAATPDPCPPLTAAGMTFIAREEVSDAVVYQRRFQNLTCPPPPSGVTIGIGYDCRFVKFSEFEADWGDVLPPEVLTEFASVLGKQGTAALLSAVSTATVPLAGAMRVFAARSLPKYLAQTRSIYPEVDTAILTPAQRTALVSLVYNRGTDLDGDRRREMLAIRTLLAAGRIDDVPEQFESMTRLWEPAVAGGLIRRRRSEALLWRSGFAPLQLD